MIEWVNQNLDSTATIYLLYTGNRFYYYQRQVVSGGYNSERYLLSWIKSASSATALANQLRQSGITHIIEHRSRTAQALPDLLTAEEKIVWAEFSEKNLSLIHESGPLALFAINLQATAPEPAVPEPSPSKPAEAG